MKDVPLYVKLLAQLKELVSWFKSLVINDLGQDNNSSNLQNNSLKSVAKSRNNSVVAPLADTLQFSQEQQQELPLHDSANQQNPLRDIRDQYTRLETKIKELQEQHDFLDQKIKSLRKSKNISDLSPEQSFRVGKQIEEAKAEREQIAQQLEELEKKLGSENLYSTLIKLGYRQQVQLFRQLIETESVAAFLIHGSPDYGQRWLLNRLVVKYVPHSLTGKVVKIDLSRKVRKNGISALWRELGGRFGLPEGQRSPSDVAEQICQCWQTQNVLLVFDEANCIPEDSLQELFQDFWLQLVSKVPDSLDQVRQFKLLMFLVDYEGCAGNWNVPFAEDLDLRKPYTPIRAPKLIKFSNSELTDWIEYEYDELPAELTKNVNSAVQEILTMSEEGIPELVLEEICRQCGCNWYEESEKWLKL